MYDGPTLVALAVTDQLDDGLSAIYTFFDPALDERSLGVYAVLSQIAECRRRGLPYLYLGYWIRDCAKMRYKTDYRPVELLVNNRWVQMS
jgi:arginine-tRNA-protein transferase